MQIGMRHQKSSCEQSVMLCCGAEASETADFSATYVWQNVKGTGTYIFLLFSEVSGMLCIVKILLSIYSMMNVGEDEIQR